MPTPTKQATFKQCCNSKGYSWATNLRHRKRLGVILASQSIKVDQQVAGTIIAGFDLSSLAYIDALKSKVDVECTIIAGDTRLAQPLLIRANVPLAP